MSEGQRITDPGHAKTFVLAGKALFTLKSLKSGDHITFKVKKPRDDTRRGPSHFVSVLDHADGHGGYSYLGVLNRDLFEVTRKSPYYGQADAKPVRAAGWFFTRLLCRGELSDDLELWHEGRCGRCGRRLTHPESIQSGMGPECRGKL